MSERVSIESLWENRPFIPIWNTCSLYEQLRKRKISILTCNVFWWKGFLPSTDSSFPSGDSAYVCRAHFRCKFFFGYSVNVNVFICSYNQILSIYIFFSSHTWEVTESQIFIAFKSHIFPIPFVVVCMALISIFFSFISLTFISKNKTIFNRNIIHSIASIFTCNRRYQKSHETSNRLVFSFEWMFETRLWARCDGIVIETQFQWLWLNFIALVQNFCAFDA